MNIDDAEISVSILQTLEVSDEDEKGLMFSGKPWLFESAVIEVTHSGPDDYVLLREMYAAASEDHIPFSVCLDYKTNSIVVRILFPNGIVTINSLVPREKIISVYEAYCHSSVLYVAIFFREDFARVCKLKTVVSSPYIVYEDDGLIVEEVGRWLLRN